MRVLIVEDKEENTYYLRALLEGHGYQVESARHGAEALVMARQSPPDVVISDLLMPVMDGYTLLRYWKADERLKKIPFIVYTATYTDAEDERLAYDLGADGFILKPCEPDIFLARLRAVQVQGTASTPAAKNVSGTNEETNFQHYSQALIRKLEEKSLQLEQANKVMEKELAERRAIEKEVKLKNTILQTVQETGLDAILVIGIDHEILSYNRNFVELWKIPDAILSKGLDGPALDYAAGQVADQPEFVAKTRYLYEHRDEVCLDEIELKDGRVIDRYSAPVVGEEGVYFGRIWYFRDVTETRHTQQSLRNSELEQRQLVRLLESERSRLTSAQKVAKIGSWETDLETQEVIWSAETYRIFELDPETFRPSHPRFMERVHPEDRKTVDDAFVASLHSQSPFAIEHRILTRDGRIKFVEERWQVSFDDAGKPIRAFGTCQDISERMQTEAALQISEKRYRTLIETMLEGYAYCQAVFENDKLVDFVFLDVNTALSVLTGLSNVVGKRVTDLIPDILETNAEVFEIYDRVLRSGKPEKFETYVHGLGRWFNVTVYSTDGKHFTEIFENITRRKETDARIRYLNRVYAMLSDINALIVRVHAQDELFHETCQIAVKAGGFRMAMIALLDNATGSIRPVASVGKSDALMAKINGILSANEQVRTTMVMRAIAEKRAIIANNSIGEEALAFPADYAEAGVKSIAVLPLVVNDKSVGVLALYAGESEFFHEEEMRLLTDLTGDIAFAIDHIDKQERLNYLAYYDELTNLANRNLFLDRVEQLIHGARRNDHRLAVVLMNVERFKNINDSLGRAAGDLLLKQIADWLIKHAGDESLLTRLEADHFAIVVPEIRKDGDLTKLLNKMADALLSHTFTLNNVNMRIAAKGGVALFPDDGGDAEMLLRNAEAALKQAKNTGARYLFHAKAMTELVAHKLEMENRLRDAIDREEFVLHYQPKVNIETGKVVSAEALIRWNDPQSGLVAPGKFIPVLEETGLIYEVGRWALRQAISDYLRWRASGFEPVRIAVNVSPMQLRDPAFVEELHRNLSVDPNAAHGLELEITESMIMEDMNRSIESLKAIRSLGVKVAIDDFGTGFSSLGYLSKLPVDTLKVDRSFINDMTDDSEGLALVTTIINLAHGLNLTVVAEGVETEEQLRLLNQLQCDEMQGFIFSKPLPVNVFESKYLQK